MPLQLGETMSGTHRVSRGPDNSLEGTAKWRWCIVILCGFCMQSLAYTGYGHRMTTRAALKVLGLNGYGRVQNRLTNEGSITGYPNYIDFLTAMATDPDESPFPDPELASRVNECIRTLIGNVFETSLAERVLDEIVEITQDASIEEIVADLLENGYYETSLRQGTQHTLPYDPYLTLPITTNRWATVTEAGGLLGYNWHTTDITAHLGTLNGVASSFAALLDASEIIDREYRQAVRAIGGQAFYYATDAQKVSSMKSLGRALHYIQDVTVPHHTELPGNFYDLFVMIIGVLNGEDEETIERKTSQWRYEGEFIQNTYYFNEVKGQIYVKATDEPLLSWAEWNDEMSGLAEIRDRPVSWMVRDVRSTVFLGHFMDYCNGLPNYRINDYRTYTGGWIPWLYHIYDTEDYDDLMNLAKGYFLLDVDHNYLEGRRQVLVQGGYTEHPTSRSDKNDDFAMVARHLLPLAVKYTAAVIAKYADDVRLDFPFDHFGHTGDVVSVELVDPPERVDTRTQ